MSLKKEITKLCLDKDITLTQLAQKIDIERSLMYYKIKHNDISTIEKIEKALDLEPGELTKQYHLPD